MPLTLHHLNKSQSERILFLLEELGLPFTLVLHQRNPQTALAPDSLKAVHPSGTAPVLIDTPPNPANTDVSIAESSAIVEYILAAYGAGKLSRKPGDADYIDYLKWLHYANGTLQPAFSRMMALSRAGVASDQMVFQFYTKKIHNGLGQMEEQLGKTGAYLAGRELTAADCMNVFTLTTMRGFYPFDLGGYPGILAYLKRVSEREGYKRAMAQGDPGMEPMIGPKVEKFVFG